MTHWSSVVKRWLAVWAHVADSAQAFAPLLFELAGQVMRGKEWAGPLRTWLVEGWIGALADLHRQAGCPPEGAISEARIALAVARGLLFELALTGDREAADHAMRDLAQRVRRDM